MPLVGAGNFVQLSSLAAFESERVKKGNYYQVLVFTVLLLLLYVLVEAGAVS